MEQFIRSAALRRGLAVTCLSAALAGIGITSAAQAQTVHAESESPPSATTTPEADADSAVPIEAETATSMGLAPYTYADLFSIGLPEGWQATEQTDAPQVILTNSGDNIPEAETARIEITWHNQPPQVVVAQLLNDLKAGGYQVSRYESEDIDNTTALNIWLSELPDDFPNAFMSYIGYAETTAAVVSYYTASNSDLASLLVEVHQSFERLE